jgi:hypothetical protein
MKLTGVKHILATQYHPHTGGQVENKNRTIKSVIAKLTQGMQSMWSYYLPFVQYVYNCKIHQILNSTPFSMMLARPPNPLVNYINSDNIETPELDYEQDINNWKHYCEQVISLVYPTLALKNQDAKQYQLNHMLQIRKNIFKQELPTGTAVMILDPQYIKNPHTRPTHISKYLDTTYYIIKRYLNGPYQVKDRHGNILDRHIPLDQMKVLRLARSYGELEKDDEDIYEVESILDERKTKKRVEFQVKWRGYDELTWEPIEHLDHCGKALQLYYSKKQQSQFNSLNLNQPQIKYHHALLYSPTVLFQ